MKSFILTSVSALIVCLSCSNSPKSREDVPGNAAGINVKVLNDELRFPWELVWGPDKMLWMTERGGRVSRVDPASGKVYPLITISDVYEKGEGGLLGMALHPNFSKTPYVYVEYDYRKDGSSFGKVVRYTYKNNTLTEPHTLLDNIAAANIHNGSRLLIVGGKLYITTGDASNQSNPQKLSSLNGKILRINLDGSIPADNPTKGSPVWSYGHRNPQGLVYAKGKLYSSEHGPDTDDEINIIHKGRNYGWPKVRGVCDEADEKEFCAANNIAQPIYRWTPTIATCGLDYYNGSLFPQWKNSLLMATLKGSSLYQLKLNAAGDKVESVSTYFRFEHGRLRDVCVAPDGKVYLITSNGSNDKLLVLSSSK
ncbi:MAG: PQQ-dependent sugar dehydrogenase [Sphingobacteriaceae bacterium]|nr:PQQ-dependent sugar dehydrogenase [Sphingobacteriaceae bacterium]